MHSIVWLLPWYLLNTWQCNKYFCNARDCSGISRLTGYISDTWQHISSSIFTVHINCWAVYLPVQCGEPAGHLLVHTLYTCLWHFTGSHGHQFSCSTHTAYAAQAYYILPVYHDSIKCMAAMYIGDHWPCSGCAGSVFVNTLYAFTVWY